MDISMILLALGFLLAFVMSMNLGGNDAANPTSAAVGSGVLTLRRALLFFGIFVFFGAVLQGSMVMKTIGKGIVPEIDVVGAFAIILSANIWIFLATMRGMAISTTHSIICAVIGYGLVEFGISGINFSVLGTIVLSWIASPLCSLALAYILFKMIDIYTNRNDGAKLQKFFKILLIGSLCFSAYSFGANDVANATGVYITIASKMGQVPDSVAMVELAIFGTIGIVLGAFIFGPKVIRTLAFRVTRLDLPTGLAASLSNAMVVYLFTTVPYILSGYGLPISTSYAAVGAILGASIAAKKRLSKSASVYLISYWLVTVPANILLSGAVVYIIKMLVA
ncbi:MAG: inorganic phosphate transporter [Candidatus Methanosuratincola sp.]|jgi:PiT family inorganic phosphate transporter|nr:inorganic phosphate transporter [Candidatus Methanosuratincola sp.]